MEIKNEHIRTAYQLISSLSVSGDVVDVIWAARQQLIMADREAAPTEKLEEVDG